MTKDCGCDKKHKGEQNKIWKYIKGYEPIQIHNTSASYQGKNGFRYFGIISIYHWREGFRRPTFARVTLQVLQAARRFPVSSWAPPYRMGTIWSTQVASPVQVGPAIRHLYPSRSRTIFRIFFHGAET